MSILKHNNKITTGVHIQILITTTTNFSYTLYIKNNITIRIKVIQINNLINTITEVHIFSITIEIDQGFSTLTWDVEVVIITIRKDLLITILVISEVIILEETTGIIIREHFTNIRMLEMTCILIKILSTKLAFQTMVRTVRVLKYKMLLS